MIKTTRNGFGLTDAIVSLSLLAGVITYGTYFSSIRLNTVHSSNLIRSINKEIERDIERLKLDLWNLNYDKDIGKYIFEEYECSNPSEGSVVNLPSWIKSNNSVLEIQSWRPGAERSKIFTGKKVLITREIMMIRTLGDPYASDGAIINYRAEWGGKNEHWLSIEFVPEFYSWCEQNIY